MQDTENITKNLEGLTPEESAKLIELERSVALDEARPNITKNFLSFVKYVWPEFIEGSHHKIINKKFNDLAQGKIKRLIINMPPRHTKSEFASYLLPAWMIGKNPKLKIIQATHTADLAIDFGRKTKNLVDEKIMKRFLGLGEPTSKTIRAGHANIHHHLDYISYLADRRRWLAGDHMSLADLAAAAHLSCVDYLGDVPWEQHPSAKDWFARVKSRPSFRPLLEDHIPGVAPAKHYADLDF